MTSKSGSNTGSMFKPRDMTPESSEQQGLAGLSSERERSVVFHLVRSSWQCGKTGVEFPPMPTTPAPPLLKLLPAYLGVASLDDALRHPRISRILWLEILVNDSIEWTTLRQPVVQEAYETACRWYTRYRTLVSGLVSRAPLPEDHGPIDERFHRQLAEALEFAHAHA